MARTVEPGRFAHGRPGCAHRQQDPYRDHLWASGSPCSVMLILVWGRALLGLLPGLWPHFSRDGPAHHHPGRSPLWHPTHRLHLRFHQHGPHAGEGCGPTWAGSSSTEQATTTSASSSRQCWRQWPWAAPSSSVKCATGRLLRRSTRAPPEGPETHPPCERGPSHAARAAASSYFPLARPAAASGATAIQRDHDQHGGLVADVRKTEPRGDRAPTGA